MYHDNKPFAAAQAVIADMRTKSESDPLEMLAEKLADMTDATIKRIEETEKKQAALDSTLDDHEKRLARKGGGNAAPVTWGQQFIAEKAEDITGLSEASGGAVKLNIKSVTGATTSGGAIDVPMRDNTAMLPQRSLVVRSLLNVIQTESGTVEYAAQTTRPTAADTVAEEALKPESDIAWELRNVPTRVIAHWVKASSQILSDAPQIGGMIDSELRYGLALKEEQQLLYGDNTGANLNGLTPNAAAFVDPLSGAIPAVNKLDEIGLAVLQVSLADFMPSGIVLHPSDWWEMRLLKDADNRYILGDPQSAVAPNLFGLPVVPTKAMTAGEFLVGDMFSAATFYDRWQPRVEVGFVDDDFTRNMVTIRAEERVALAVRHGDAMSYGTFA